jgi:hypothetical protein
MIVSLSPAEMLFALFGIYAISAPTYWFWRRIRRRRRPTTADKE